MLQVLEKEHLKLDKPVKVYNLEVEGAHTYFVGKNGQNVLVHNQFGGTEQYTDQFEKMLKKARADYNGRLRYLIRNMPYSYSTLGPICDSMIWQNNYDNDGILRFYKLRLDTMERVQQVASSLSPENKNHLFHTVITLYKVNAYAWWINSSGWELNCHTWTEKARNSINALSLPYDKGFDIGYTTYEVVPGTENQRGRDLKGWKDHSFVTITINPTSETPATTFYFDNGGLGIPWFNGKGFSYGGIFWEIPPWLQYHIPEASNDGP